MRDLNIYTRHLPHWRIDGSVYYITFNTKLTELDFESREIALKAIKFFHLSRIYLSIAVVMPDHVHAILQPLEETPGKWFDLTDLLGVIKGYSARKINEHLGRNGVVWQSETHDRIIRNEKEYLEKWNYIFENPVRAKIVKKPEDYKFTFKPDK
jgi:putative transposase